MKEVCKSCKKPVMIMDVDRSIGCLNPKCDKYKQILKKG